MTQDLDAAVKDVIDAGADRLLTSGGAQSALLGNAPLKKIIREYGDKIQIMVCGGVRASNVAQIMDSTGARQFHAAVRQEIGSSVKYRPQSLHLGATRADDYARKVVVSDDVRGLRAAMEKTKIS